MKVGVLAVLLVGALVSEVYSAIVAVESDFAVECGTEVGGPVSVTYTNSQSAANPVAKLSSSTGPATCSATGTGGVFTISDVRTNCNIEQPDPTLPEYVLQLTLQEYDGVYQNTDPTFIFKCSYTVDSVDVSSVQIGGTGQLSASATSVTLNATGNPDMDYTLTVVEIPSQDEATSASFGDQVALKISMSGTDDDEKGIQVESCVVKSGAVSLSIIENFCVVADKGGLFQLPGFISTPPPTPSATFPITLFALEGSDDIRSLEFECSVKVCPSDCFGQNCQTPARRKKRAAGDEPVEKSVKMATKIELLPIGVLNSGSRGQTGQDGSSSASCIQSLGFIVTVVVLAVLLLVAMTAVVFLFTARRRELQKQGA